VTAVYRQEEAVDHVESHGQVERGAAQLRTQTLEAEAGCGPSRRLADQRFGAARRGSPRRDISPDCWRSREEVLLLMKEEEGTSLRV